MKQLPGKAECCWTATASETAYPRLQGRQRFDAVIVGGGIVGLTAALQLAWEGKRVAVVEALRIGRQVTGRSTAKITTQHGLIYRHLIDAHGTDKARLYANANATAFRYIERLVVDRRLDCDYETRDAFVYVGPGSGRRDDLDAEAQAARSLGLDAEVLEAAPLPFPTGGALRFPRQAQFNPAKYLIAAGSLAAAAGVSVFEHTRIKTIEAGSRWRMHASDGEIDAHDVVVASNIPVAGPHNYDAVVQPRCHLAMAFGIDPENAPNGMFIAAEEPFHSIRTGDDGSGLVLVVLGPRFNTGQEADTAGRFRELEDWVRKNFRIRDVRWRWTNEDMDTADRLGFVGAPDPESGFYVATGFNAWGITNGTAAGLLIADQILGRANPWSSLFDPGRAYPKDFNQGGSTATPIDAITNIHAGEGGVIEHEGEKLAVWKDEGGIVRAVSAKCTHKGCLVSWNNADRTWDCPCHGSIFASDGSVIHGPAVEPLPVRSVHDGRR
jgi:glycine/D-amino acid oxidase-like deaminating enzyme/nitrite reductase/ring-hydroxylating ferredoxin subunit